MVKADDIKRRGLTHLPIVLELNQYDLEHIEDFREREALKVVIDLWIKARRGNDKNFEKSRFSLSKEVLNAKWTDFLVP